MLRWLVLAISVCLGAVSYPAQSFWHGNASGGGTSSCLTIGNQTCDANGWTVFNVNPSGYCGGYLCTVDPNKTMVLYVDPTTSPANDCNSAGCGSKATPLHTMKYGHENLMRHDSPDWELAIRGSVFADDCIDDVRHAGLSNNYPEIFGSYDNADNNMPPNPHATTGGANPECRLTSAYYSTHNAPFGTSGGVEIANHIAVVGWKFYACTRDPNATECAFSLTDAATNEPGIELNETFDGGLIEDCWSGFFADANAAPSAYNAANNLFIRRSQFLSNYPPANVNGNGLLIDEWIGTPSTVVMVENVFDHNGWNTDNAGITWAPPSGTRHNAYIQNYSAAGDTATLQGPVGMLHNIFSNDGAAPQFRPGGNYSDNLFMQSPFGFSGQAPSAFAGTVSSNVFVNLVPNATVPSTTVLGFGGGDFETSPVLGTLSVINNLAINNVASPGGRGFALSLTASGGASNVTGSTATGNIVYNTAASNTGQALYTPTGAVYNIAINNPGSSYADNTVGINSAAASSGAYAGQNYITIVTPDTSQIAMDGMAMFKVGSGGNAVQGPFHTHVIDNGVITAFGSVTAGTNAANGTYNGVSLTGGSGAGATANLVVTGGGVTTATLVGGGISYATSDTLACSSLENFTVSSGTYTSGTGAVSLTLSASSPLASTNKIVAGLSGTTGIGSLNGTFSATAGTTGTTVNYTATSGLGSITITGGTLGVGCPTGLSIPVSTTIGHAVLFGTNFSAVAPAANGGATFTGTLYQPWYQVGIASGSSGSGLLVDLISANNVIVWAGIGGADGANNLIGPSFGTGYSNTDTLVVAAPGTACGSGALNCTNGWSWNGSSNVGSGLTLTPTIAVNTISATGCTLASQNDVDPTGANVNSCAHTHPNRTAGSYYATLAGSTPFTTFTGVIASGVLTISSISGANNPACGTQICLGDAITWSGQTDSDFIKTFGTGTGGNGTYNLAGTESVGSGSMSSYTAQQLINLQRNQNQGNWTSNNPLSACNVNNYFRAGFGVSAMTCPAGG